MKFTRIFGVVVFLHVLVISLVLVQPGCQTKKAPAPTPEPEPVVAAPDPALSPDFNPVPLGGTPAAGTASAAPAPAVAPGTRSAPTRPTVQIAPGGSSVIPADTAGSPAPAATGSRTHVVARGDSLWAIARKHGVKVEEILEANGLTRTSTIQPGQSLVIPGGAADVGTVAPASGPGPVAAPAAAVPAGEGTRYVVKAGDTLSRIASRQGTTVAALRAANNLRSDTIRLGQELVIPGAGGSAPALGGDVAVAERAVSAPEPAASGVTHTVAPGEAPAVIARRYGVTVEALMRANNVTDARRLRVGQVLVIPGGGRSGATPVQVAAQPSNLPPAPPPLIPASTAAPAGPAAVTPSQLEQIPLDEDVPLIPVDGPPPPPRR